MRTLEFEWNLNRISEAQIPEDGLKKVVEPFSVKVVEGGVRSVGVLRSVEM